MRAYLIAFSPALPTDSISRPKPLTVLQADADNVMPRAVIAMMALRNMVGFLSNGSKGCKVCDVLLLNNQNAVTSTAHIRHSADRFAP
jgi:hypothetical protein